MGVGGDEFEPVHDGFFMRVTAVFLLVGTNGVERRIGLGKILDGGAHFREWLYRRKSRGCLDSGVGRRDSNAIPLFSSEIFGRKKENFAGAVGRIGIFCGRENDQAGALFVVACEVIEIIFLREDVSLRKLFAACKNPEDDGAIVL